jgi:hypothetical protein
MLLIFNRSHHARLKAHFMPLPDWPAVCS